MLTPEEYDANERKWITVLPNRIIEAFQPEAFNLVGYPTRIRSIKELHRYADVMHETGMEGIFELYLKGLTKEEFDLLKEITVRVRNITEACCEKPIVPRSALLWAFVALRHVRSLFPDPKATTIMEVGPGSGYLGCLCGLLGYKYVGVDVTQAFYIYQSRLWHSMFGDRLIELASRSDSLSDFSHLNGGELLHVPWWKFSTPRPHEINLDIDCVAFVDVITEMHIHAMRYTGRQVARWLRNSTGNKVLFVQGTGAQLRIKIIDIIGALRLMGFELAYSDKMDVPERYAPHDMFFFFTPNDRPFSPARRSSSTGMLSALSGKVLTSFENEPNTKSQWQSTIEMARQHYRELAGIGISEVRSFHKELSGNSDHDTDDEKFWNFCNGQEWKWY